MKKLILVITSCLIVDAANDVSPVTRNQIRKYVENRRNGTEHDVAISNLISTDAVGFEAAFYVGAHNSAIAKAKNNRLRLDEGYLKPRINQQFGESAAGGGATSLVSRTGVANLVSAALENGALARDKQGTVTTFRANAYAVYRMFGGAERACSIVNPACDTPGELALRGLSASIAFDNAAPQPILTADTKSATGTPATGPLTFLGQGGQISSVGVRYNYLRRTSPTTKDQIAVWKTALNKTNVSSKALVEQLETFANNLAAKPGLNLFEKEVSEGFDNAFKATPQSPTLVQDLVALYQTAFDKLFPGVNRTDLDNLTEANRSFNSNLDDALASILLKSETTVEYNHVKPPNQVALSTFRFAVDKKIHRKSRRSANAADDDYDGLLTANGSLELYESRPSGLNGGRLRDIQMGGQFDLKLGSPNWEARPLFSVAGYYQYQKENAILEFNKNPQTPYGSIPLPKPAVEVLNTKGHIGIVQGKLTIPIGKVLTLPLSVSWSNRTELIKASEIRGQFGISVDVDKLFAK